MLAAHAVALALSLGQLSDPSRAAGAPAPAVTWSGSASLGLLSLTGTGASALLTAGAAAERRTDGSILGIRASAAWGETRGSSTGLTETTAQQAGALLRGDRRFTPATSAYLLGGLETDHVKSVELRTTGEAGVAVVWVEWSDAGGRQGTLRSDLGLRLARERRFQYFPAASSGPLPAAVLVAPRLALALRHALGEEVLLTGEAEALPNVRGDARVVVNGLGKVAARLGQGLHLAVHFTVGHDSAPAAGKRPTDTALGASLEALF